MINRSTARDTPNDPMALYLVALLFGTLVAETILASVHVRAHQQAGHMGASDLIKNTAKTPCEEGRPSTYGLTYACQAVANNIRGLLKTFGHVIARGCKGPFPIRVRDAIGDNQALSAIIEPLLAAWLAIREQVTIFDRQVVLRAKADAAARRLMSVPGVIVTLAYMAVIDDPARFKQSTSVGAYLGLTPRRYQSGEVDKAGCISKCGDRLLRSYLFEAANVLLVRHPKPSKLRTWGLGLAARIGMRRAKVAVARKLAVIMHRVWKDDRDFDWGAAAAAI